MGRAGNLRRWLVSPQTVASYRVWVTWICSNEVVPGDAKRTLCMHASLDGTEMPKCEPRGIRPIGSFLCAAVDPTVCRNEGQDHACPKSRPRSLSRPSPHRRQAPALAADLERVAQGEHPSEEDLRDAPLLMEWTVRLAPVPHLFGIVLGHPWIPDGYECRTSELFTYDPTIGYARTLSRFYRLLPRPADAGPR